MKVDLGTKWVAVHTHAQLVFCVRHMSTVRDTNTSIMPIVYTHPVLHKRQAYVES